MILIKIRAEGADPKLEENASILQIWKKKKAI